MEKHRSADKESPHQQLRPARLQRRSGVLKVAPETEQTGGQNHGYDDIKAVQPDEFGEFGEVPDLGVIGREIAPARDPADVRP